MRKTGFKVLAVAFAVLVSASMGAQAAVSDAKREAIIELLDVTGATELGFQMMDTMAQTMGQAMQQRNPNLPPRAIEIVREEMLSEFRSRESELTEVYVDIYDRHFTLSEIRELIAFYETPIGVKSLQKMPQIVQEGAVAGQQWAAAAIPNVMRSIQTRLEREGIAR